MDDDMITSDPDVMVGKPVIRGTRITVELIMENISSGWAIADILRAYPHLTREQVIAALKFATEIEGTNDNDRIKSNR